MALTLNLFIHLQLNEDGATALAAIVLVWSGVFPYLKLVLICVVDCVGRNPNHPTRRHWGLLSVLAKWSFLDVWIVALTVLCVRMDVEKEHTLMNMGFWQEKFYLKIWTQAVALRGCYCFAAALVFSQFLGHFAITRAMGSRKEERKLSVSYAEHPLFASMPLKSLMMRTPGGPGSVAITFFSVASLVGLALGICLPCLHIEYHFNLRIKRWIIDESINIPDIRATYSIAGAAYAMGGVNHTGAENIGMSILTFAFVVVAPLLRCFLSLLLWFVPMRGVVQRGVADAADSLSVVAAADVFAACGFVMVWQLPRLFANMEDAARYVALEMRPYFGLYLFGVAGLIDSCVAPAIRRRYAAALRHDQNELAAMPQGSLVAVQTADSVAVVEEGATTGVGGGG